MKFNNLLSRAINYVSFVKEIKIQKIIIDIIWNIASVGITKLRGFILTPVISYFCGIEWYGAWVLMYSLTIYALTFCTLQLPNAIVRFFPEEKEIRDEIYIFCSLNIFLNSAVMSLLLAGSANYICLFFFKNLDFSNLIIAGSLLLITLSFQRVLANYFKARDNIKTSSSIEALFSVVEVVSVTLTLAFTKNLILAVVAFFVSSLLIEIVIATKVIKLLPLRSILSKAVVVRYFQYLKYSLPLVPSSLTETFAANGDRFIVAYFLGAKDVGIYSIAYALGSSIMIFIGPIFYSLFPKVCKLWADGNIREARSIIWKSTKLFLASGAICLVIILLFGNQLLLALAGKEYDILENDGLVVSLIVMIGVLFYGLMRIQSLYLFVTKETKLVFFINLSNCILNLILNIILTSRMGIVGAALATVITYVAGLIILNCYINSRKEILMSGE